MIPVLAGAIHYTLDGGGVRILWRGLLKAFALQLEEAAMWRCVAVFLSLVFILPVAYADAKDVKAEGAAPRHGFKKVQAASVDDAALAAGPLAHAYATVAVRLSDAEDV